MKRSDAVILCDLGGVLIDLNWQNSARALFGENLDSEILKSRWLSLQSTRGFEAGKIDFLTFYHEFVSETGSSINIEEFKNEFASILGPVKHGCMEILVEIGQHARLAMLSNTNLLHVEVLRHNCEVFAPFDHLFLSYEMGMVKPDAQIFTSVCERLGCLPERVFFFDDSELNVMAAKTCGLHSWRVDSPQEILKIVDAYRSSGVI